MTFTARLLRCFPFLVLAASLPLPAQTKHKVDTLAQGFATPPKSARLWCYWWWLNGNVTEQSITNDLTEMKAKGYGGVLLVDANGADQNNNGRVPAGPAFGSPAWTKLYLHALKLAHQLDLEVTFNIISGWNVGGPDVKPEDASKLLTFSREVVTAGTSAKLPAEPHTRNDFYRQIGVLAYPLHHGAALPGQGERPAIKNLALKAAIREGGVSMEDTANLLDANDAASLSTADADAQLNEVVDLGTKVNSSGQLDWQAPAGKDSWEVLRVGYTDSGAKVSTSSDTWQGLAIDYLDPQILTRFWNATVAPLLDAAHDYTGNTLKNVASDSWELGGTNWTGNFRQEFRRRRGYDPVPFLPIVSGRILSSRAESDRFLTDLRRTVGDLVTAHYDRMAELAGKYGMGVQSESGGPHVAPFDALETFRHSAIPQTEFWAMSPTHRLGDQARFFAKESASAAHIYGKPIAADEGLTSIGNQWNESLDMNLKPTFDQGLTEGMNRLVWHAFTSSPKEMGLPGQEYFAGTHMNPQVTWWNQSVPFFTYLNRGQYLMQQGQPVADLLYYYGNLVPNFVRLKSDDPARVLPGFEYDVTNTDALLHHLVAANGDLHTPEGIHYKALALPRYRVLTSAALDFIASYLRSGGSVIGLRPLRPQGLVPEADVAQFDATVASLWDPCEKSPSHQAEVDRGHLYCTESSREALTAAGVGPDFEAEPAGVSKLDFVHRRIEATGTDIYLVRNTGVEPVDTVATFRVSGKQPEIFDAVSGQVSASMLFSSTADGRTRVPLNLAPRGSVFLIFRHAGSTASVVRLALNGSVVYDAKALLNKLPQDLRLTSSGVGAASTLTLSTLTAGEWDITDSAGSVRHARVSNGESVTLSEPWTLSFPPNWGAPPSVQFPMLNSWTESKVDGVRYFSGTATYRSTVKLTGQQAHSMNRLDLGEVHELAHVRVNGRDAGILWARPFQANVEGMLHEGDNAIEVEVTNFWPNRIIGDARTGEHFTRTNIHAFNASSPLLPSGLLGPVILRSVPQVHIPQRESVAKL